MPSADTYQFDRALQEFLVWQNVADAERSDAPSWWWSSALALRDDARPLPGDVAAALGPFGATYGHLARRILQEIGAQEFKPWPDEFPTKFSSHGSEEAAASAEPAAQAASVAATPIA